MLEARQRAEDRLVLEGAQRPKRRRKRKKR